MTSLQVESSWFARIASVRTMEQEIEQCLRPDPWTSPTGVAPEKRNGFWRRAAPLLEILRKQDLRTFDFQKNWRTIDALLQIGVEYARPKTTSGLVEMQRIFMKAHKKMLAEMQADEPHIVEAIRRENEDTP